MARIKVLIRLTGLNGLPFILFFNVKIDNRNAIIILTTAIPIANRPRFLHPRSPTGERATARYKSGSIVERSNCLNTLFILSSFSPYIQKFYHE